MKEGVEKMTGKAYRIKMFSVLFAVLFLFSFKCAYATKEVTYKNWEAVATAMGEHLDNAAEIYEKGGDNAAKEATDTVNVAYFKFYEKLGFEKTTMSSISGKRGSDVEHQFYKVKKCLREQATVDDFKKEVEVLKQMLMEDARTLDGPQPQGIRTFFTVLWLTLREGLEAILVIAAIVAYLDKTGNRQHKKTIYFGAVLGILFSVILAIVFNMLATNIGDSLSGVSQEVFEGITMFIAVAVLFYVSNWMLSKSEVEAWDKYIKNKVEQSITTGNKIALGFSAFLAVAREGAELILFFQGMRSNIATNPSYMWLGLAVSIVVLTAVYYAIAKLSIRLPLRQFFTATSALMFLLCLSFMGKGVFELQEAGVIGRTVISWMNGFTVDILGVYPRVETIVPQIILLIITVITVVINKRNNKKLKIDTKKE